MHVAASSPRWGPHRSDRPAKGLRPRVLSPLVGWGLETRAAPLRGEHAVLVPPSGLSIHIFVHLPYVDHSVTQTSCHSNPADLYAFNA